jgi:hypothetical protein
MTTWTPIPGGDAAYLDIPVGNNSTAPLLRLIVAASRGSWTAQVSIGDAGECVWVTSCESEHEARAAALRLARRTLYTALATVEETQP